MTLSAAEWLKLTLRAGDGWWHLPADQFRVAISLIALAEVHDGAPRITSTLEDLAAHLSVSETRLRRSLEALERVGFCTVWGQRGRGGLTQLVLSDLRPFGAAFCADDLNRPNTPMNTREDKSGLTKGDEFVEIDLDLLRSPPGNLAEALDSSTARDQDLLQAPPVLRSDLRSSTSRDLSRSQESTPLGPTIWVEGQEKRTQKRAGRYVKAAEIPDRAWAAADYLRAKILADNKAAILGTKPWRSGWEFPDAGKPSRVSDGSIDGLRYNWANDFRLLHEQVLAAMRNEDPAKGDDDAWTEIARTVRWLFHDQPVEPRFVVLDPAGLRDRWARIQEVRRNRLKAAANPRPARGYDNRPDPAAQRQFRTLTKENL